MRQFNGTSTIFLSICGTVASRTSSKPLPQCRSCLTCGHTSNSGVGALGGWHFLATAVEKYCVPAAGEGETSTGTWPNTSSRSLPCPGRLLAPWGAVVLHRGQDCCHRLLFVSPPRTQTASDALRLLLRSAARWTHP